MKEAHPTFTQKQGGRTLFTIFVTVLVISLTIFFFWTASPVFIFFGLILAFFSCSSLYTLIKNELWIITIEEGIFSWSSPRWPKTSGSIELADVEWMTIDDNSSKVIFGNSHSTIQSLRLYGYGYKLQDYIKEHFPRISVDYVESS